MFRHHGDRLLALSRRGLSTRDGSVYDPKSAQMVSGYQDINVTGWTNLGRAFTGLGSAVTFGFSDWVQRDLFGSDTADRYQRGGWYYAGLGVGIAGTLGVGLLARGTSLVGRAALGYTIAGDVVGVGQSDRRHRCHPWHHAVSQSIG